MADFKFKANSFTFTERDGVLVTLRDGVLVERRWDASDPEAVGRISEVTSYDPVTGLEIETRTAYSGGFVDIASPVPETGSVRTFVDYGSEAWATRTEYLTRSWASGPLKLTYREDVQDHGGSVASYFADGRLARVREADAGNTRAWTERVTFYSGVHDREVVVTLGDDGVQVEQVFLDQGTRITRETGRDWADVFDWRNYSIHFSDTGASTHTRHFDNGIYQLRYEQDGMPTLESQQDREDVRSWYSWLKEYDSEGRIERYQISFDDGIVQTRTYEEGRHFATNWRDAFDARWWSERGVTYGPDGEIVSEMLLRDDGIRFETTYLADRIVVQISDPRNSRDWSQRTETTFLDGSGSLVVERSDLGTITRSFTRDGLVVWSDESAAHWMASGQIYLLRRHDVETGAVLSERRVSADGTVETVQIAEGTAAPIDFIDDADDHLWHIRWTEIDPVANQPVRSFVEWDDGFIRQEAYKQGDLIVRLDIDGSEDAAWLSQRSNYHEGTLTSRITDLLNGQSRGEQFYPTGELKRISEAEWGDEGRPTLGWEKLFDVSGDLLQWTIVHADGIWQLRSYEAGRHAGTVWSDKKDIYWWEERFVTYGADGEVVSKTLRRDDGIETEWIVSEPYTDLITKTDTRDIRDWETIEEIVGKESGLPSSRIVTYDDGVVETTAYARPGAIYHVETRDLEDAHDWDRIYETFPYRESSQTFRSVINDDGLATTDTFQFGIRLATRVHDRSDPNDWILLEETLYDATGARTLNREFSNTGLEWIRRYEDDLLVEKRTLDHEDIYDWQERVRTYDASGNIVTFVQIPDGIVSYD